jgi:hypothetical protein
MHLRERYNETQFTYSIKVLWDRYAARGFAIAFLLMILLLFWFSQTSIIIEPYKEQVNSNPIILLNFGDGDGTGRSKGNLAKEGSASSGVKPQNPLEDAGKIKSTSSAKDPLSTSNVIAKDNISSTNKSDQDSSKGQGKAIGAGNGNGTGLGEKGNGPGKGMGLGDIEWGGGGNRTVLNKVLPPSPGGLDKLVSIKIRFNVLPDGTVGEMRPMTKGDPSLESISLKTLKKWKFNRLDSDIQMTGIITFTFKPN